MKKIPSLLLVLTLLVALVSCAEQTAPVTDRLFEEEAFSITLTSEYERKTADSGVLYASEDCSVHVTAADAAALEGSALSPDCSLREWAESYRAVNYPDAALEESGALLSLSAMSEGEEPLHRFRSFFFRSDDTVFVLTFTADAAAFSSAEPSFFTFAESFRAK